MLLNKSELWPVPKFLERFAGPRSSRSRRRTSVYAYAQQKHAKRVQSDSFVSF